MKLKIKKIHKDAIIPKYAQPGDAGMDLYALEDTNISPGRVNVVRTGITSEIPKKHEIQIRSRSGLAKKEIVVYHGVGTIDEGYRGEWLVMLYNRSCCPYKVNKGDRVAQAVLSPVVHAEIEEVSKVSQSKRGTGGFGSTGK